MTDTAGINSSTRLKLICRTRWSGKADSTSSIFEDEVHTFVLLKTLITIKVGKNKKFSKKVQNKASSLFNQYTDKTKLLLCFVSNVIFKKLNETSKKLQNSEINILDSMNHIEELRDLLLKTKREIDYYIDNAKQFITRLRDLIETDSIMKIYCRKISAVFSDEELVFCKEELILFLEKLIDGLQKRFIAEFNKNDAVYKEITYFDPRNFKSTTSFNHICLKSVAKANAIENKLALTAQLKNFALDFIEHKKKTNSWLLSSAESNHEEDRDEDEDEDEDEDKDEDVGEDKEEDEDKEDEGCEEDDEGEELTPDFLEGNHDADCYCLKCLFKYIKSNKAKIAHLYPDVLKVYRFISYLPSTQVACERSFSRLKFIKNRLRSTMSEQYLENAIILSTERDYLNKINLEEIINAIATSSSTLAKELMYSF